MSTKILAVLFLATIGCEGSGSPPVTTGGESPVALNSVAEVATAIGCTEAVETLNPFYRGMKDGGRCHVSGRLVLIYFFEDTQPRDDYVADNPGGGSKDITILEDTGEERELGPTWTVSVISGGTLQQPGAASVVDVAKQVQEATGGDLAP
jgi:hypothetical protein